MLLALWSGDCTTLARSSMFISKSFFGLSPSILNCASVSRQSLRIWARIGGHNLRANGVRFHLCGKPNSAIIPEVASLRSTLQHFSPVLCTRALESDCSRYGPFVSRKPAKAIALICAGIT